jgi:hypothetical protein
MDALRVDDTLEWKSRGSGTCEVVLLTADAEAMCQQMKIAATALAAERKAERKAAKREAKAASAEGGRPPPAPPPTSARHDAEWASGGLPDLGFEALHNHQKSAWTGGAGPSLFASPLFGGGAEHPRAELAKVAAEMRAQRAAAAAAGEDDNGYAEATAHAAIAALKLRRQRLQAVLASDEAAPGGSSKPVVQAGSFEGSDVQAGSFKRSDVSAPVAQARRARQATSIFDGMFTLFRPVGQPKASKGSNQRVGPIGWTSWSYLTDQA